jgi:hypothetical protein
MPLGRTLPNVNVLYALKACPELILDDWKVDEQGRTRSFFFGTVFVFDGRLFVRGYCPEGCYAKDREAFNDWRYPDDCRAVVFE